MLWGQCAALSNPSVSGVQYIYHLLYHRETRPFCLHNSFQFSSDSVAKYRFFPSKLHPQTVFFQCLQTPFSAKHRLEVLCTKTSTNLSLQRVPFQPCLSDGGQKTAHVEDRVLDHCCCNIFFWLVLCRLKAR